ncbi:hypothetical protein K505DRAFT_149072 [Melanomma pulvis-pyrius CBS 109.77]|uniref:Uncharacterized protein n=1 Tax=Melanomma pulvis-pyrius CBS 109.77 TaxID=1314802 RepID=A0A6A6WQ94_9PLEO|nr:hypothetical protein K505DRAFT_149072 [Melanomma pulvis-pyrius CBS 109.77]
MPLLFVVLIYYNKQPTTTPLIYIHHANSPSTSPPTPASPPVPNPRFEETHRLGADTGTGLPCPALPCPALPVPCHAIPSHPTFRTTPRSKPLARLLKRPPRPHRRSWGPPPSRRPGLHTHLRIVWVRVRRHCRAAEQSFCGSGGPSGWGERLVLGWAGLGWAGMLRRRAALDKLRSCPSADYRCYLCLGLGSS